jgi:hypothetical protein
LLLFGTVCFVVTFVKWIFSGKKIVDKQAETAPVKAESRRKEAETTPADAAPLRPAWVIPFASGGNSDQNRSIPPHSGGKPNVMPAPAPSAIPAMKIAPQIPPPIKRKIVTREDLATVFQRGARGLTRTAAVTQPVSSKHSTNSFNGWQGKMN